MWGSDLPAPVAECCAVLRGAGFSAFPVGGCVRDQLLGREPQDWDLATSAQPDMVLSLFPHTVPTGVQHGTVTVLLGGLALEVTTLRTDGNYSDGRHPDAVKLGATLCQDLARRDFTINAMALGEDGGVIDPFGGQEDLSRRRIRCVGSPETRFQEDALRMMRAMRFSAQLDFHLDQATALAIGTNAGRMSLVSAPRVRAETEKLITAENPGRGGGMLSFGLLDRFLGHRPVPAPDLSRLLVTARGGLARWSGFCALLLECGALDNPEGFLVSLCMERRIIRACSRGAALWAAGLPRDSVGWRHILAQFGPDAAQAAAAMGDTAQGTHHFTTALESVLISGAPLGSRDLALSGRDLLALGLRGPALGAAQRALLAHVLDRPEENQRDILHAILKKQVDNE